MKTRILIIAAVVVALMIGLLIRATWQIRDVNAAHAALGLADDQLREKLNQAEVRLQTARAALLEFGEDAAAPGADSADAKRGGGADSSKANQSTKPAAPRLTAYDVIADDPKKRAEYMNYLRASFDTTGVFKALGLTPDEIDKAKERMIYLQEMRLDWNTALKKFGLSRDSAEGKKLYEECNEEKMAAVLGDRIERYLDYNRGWAVRSAYAQQLPWLGMVIGETVTADQVLRTGDILAANCVRKATDSHAGWVQPETLDWAKASEQLKTVLSPGQIAAMGGLIERDQLQFKADKLKSELTDKFKASQPSR